MVKHVLLIKLRDMKTPEQKQAIMVEIKEKLMGLKALVPAIHSIDVRLNQNPRETYDICLISEHNDWDALEAYRVDPHHVEVANFIALYRESRACADFEI